MRRYAFGPSGQAVVLSASVLEHMHRHRQTRCWHREAGGLLFARLDDADVLVDEASGPRGQDRRGRFSYRPDRSAEQREIDARHVMGLHFVGTWHTHPEDHPSPSGVDLASMADIFAKSRHGLNAFVMVIVGRCVSERSIYVGVWDGETMWSLAEAPAREADLKSRPGRSLRPDVECGDEATDPPVLIVQPER